MLSLNAWSPGPVTELHFEFDADADIALALLDQEVTRPVDVSQQFDK